MNVCALGRLPPPFAPSAGDTWPHRSPASRRQLTPLHAQQDTAYAQRDLNTPGAASSLAQSACMQRANARVGSQQCVIAAQIDDAGFLDSRDLDGRPADDYGLDWLRQQGMCSPPFPPSLLSFFASPLPAVGCKPIGSACDQPWQSRQRTRYEGGKKPIGRRMAASGGCARAVRWRRARPPSTRRSPSEQLSTGTPCRSPTNSSCMRTGQRNLTTPVCTSHRFICC